MSKNNIWVFNTNPRWFKHLNNYKFKICNNNKSFCLNFCDQLIFVDTPNIHIFDMFSSILMILYSRIFEESKSIIYLLIPTNSKFVLYHSYYHSDGYQFETHYSHPGVFQYNQQQQESLKQVYRALWPLHLCDMWPVMT